MACDHMLREIQKENYFDERLELISKQKISENEVYLSTDHKIKKSNNCVEHDTTCGHGTLPLHLPNDVNDGASDDNTVDLVRIQNNFTLKNCFWFAIGALMQQGSDLYPRVRTIH